MLHFLKVPPLLDSQIIMYTLRNSLVSTNLNYGKDLPFQTPGMLLKDIFLTLEN